MVGKKHRILIAQIIGKVHCLSHDLCLLLSQRLYSSSEICGKYLKFICLENRKNETIDKWIYLNQIALLCLGYPFAES